MAAERQSAVIRYARAGAVAFNFISEIAAGVFVGYQLDRWLDTEPWLLTLMTVVGSAVAFYHMIRVLRRFQKMT